MIFFLLSLQQIKIQCQSLKIDSIFYYNTFRHPHGIGVIKCKIRGNDQEYYLVGKNYYLCEFTLGNSNISKKIKREYQEWVKFIVAHSLKDKNIEIRRKKMRFVIRKSIKLIPANKKLYLVPSCAVKDDTIQKHSLECKFDLYEIFISLFLQKKIVRWGSASGSYHILSE